MAPRNDRVLGIVLAGGKGTRLAPLTDDRAKPAVPFGGSYRIVDFALSNLVNAGFFKIVVLTQYKSHSLDRHITTTWRLSPLLDNYVTPVPAQQRRGPHWYQGSADAIYQSLNLVFDERPDYVLVFGADHIYRMDPRQMLEDHVASGRGASVAGIRVPRAEAPSYGVIDTEDGSAVRSFLEKPSDAPGLPDAPDQVLASMGNYCFTTAALIDAVRRDAADETSSHDMGGSILPGFVERGDCGVYDFKDNDVPGSTDRDRGYWRDVGTISSYYDATMDLVAVHPVFNLYNLDWPIHTLPSPLPPAKVVHERCRVVDSLLALGVIVADAVVARSVLFSSVHVDHGARLEDAAVMHNSYIGEGAVVRRAILDKNVTVSAGAKLGIDHDHDRARGFSVTGDGIVVVGKNSIVER
jgi:glucose-1-phosphate adenylyltransferase